PHGGTRVALGTNPISAAMPSGDGPIVVDSATSLVTKGRCERLRDAGSPLPAGAAIGSQGLATTDAAAAAALLPPGGHSGTVIGIVVEALTNAAAGYLGSGDDRAALVLALPSLELEAEIDAVGSDLRERLLEGGGKVPGQGRLAKAAEVQVDAEVLAALR